ncbi:hypothetical protein KKH30_04110 [Candidatus Micrarchaeota archaeon]|nr:hypothetical protein [Candidatus Micrarchaeota archaeon]MBU1939923.1 hypothetical protein [Candidatus Micrarchaeota archaeon]
MAETLVLCGKVLDSIEELNSGMNEKQWGEYDRTPFVHSLKKAIGELEGIESLVAMLNSSFERGGREGPDTEEYLGEMKALITLLKRNRELEDGKRTNSEDGVPELYSSLEQKVLGMLLKTRHLVERAELAGRKGDAKHYAGRSAHRNVLELLERKETELQKVKESYEQLRNRSFMGVLEEHTSADIEKEMNDLARGLESAGSYISVRIDAQKKQMDALSRGYDEMEQKLRSMEEINSQHMVKASELTLALKKERDYAKKVLLDTEHETLKLRNTYSRELLSLEGEKQRAREDAKEKSAERVSSLERELIEKSAMLKRLEAILHERELQVSSLQNKVKQKAKKKKG